MSFEAQITLSNMANGPTADKNNIDNQFSCKVYQICLINPYSIYN